MNGDIADCISKTDYEMLFGDLQDLRNWHEHFLNLLLSGEDFVIAFCACADDTFESLYLSYMTRHRIVNHLLVVCFPTMLYQAV